jgi:hypothetical protein
VLCHGQNERAYKKRLRQQFATWIEVVPIIAEEPKATVPNRCRRKKPSYPAFLDTPPKSAGFRTASN